MGEAFVELGAEGINALTDKYWDTGYDYLSKKRAPPRVAELKEQVKGGLGFSSHHQQSNHKPHKHHNRLPSPEGDVDPRDKDFYSQSGRRRRESSIERESETSHRVRHEYRRERDDPVRKPESVLSKRDLNSIRDDRRDSRMSHANGYADRPRSQQPPRSRYGGYDDDDSDYDERTGKRYSARGRGYDDRDDDVPYDREVIETERYRGVSGALIVSIAGSHRVKAQIADVFYSLLDHTIARTAIAQVAHTIRTDTEPAQVR